MIDNFEGVEDIEDLFTLNESAEFERVNRDSVTFRTNKRRNKITIEEKKIEKNCDTKDTTNNNTDGNYCNGSSIPGVESVYVKTWGCTHNSSDSEYMAGLLSNYGYALTENKSDADVWLLNSCTVKSPAEDHFRNEIDEARKSGKSIVVAGCVPQGAPKSTYLKGLSVIGVQQIDRVVEVVEETLKGNSVRLLGQKKVKGKRLGGSSLSLPKIRRNKLIEIIAINSGCLNQCTYCKTKHARGDLASYSIEEIVDRARESFKEGVVEIWLTSEDTGAYGRDIDTSLPELLEKLVTVIPEGCMLRIGMTNPPYILEHLEAIAKILNHSRVYSFLHIPVQSGSDSVLSDMKREYSRAEFEHVVNFLNQRVPDMTVATDIICGFPTETERDFEETMDLCSKYKFPSLFINQFFPRPGTPAARMTRVPPKEVKTRTKRLTELFHSYEPYTNLVGRTYEVLVTEIAHDNKHLVGHNKSYQQILLPKDDSLMGKLVKVKITSSSKYSMVGQVIGSREINKENGRFIQGFEKGREQHFIYAVSALAVLFALRFLWIFI